jgi:CrcB protein
MTLLLVMVGAGTGAVGRWLTDRAVLARSDAAFPLGTFAVNVIGSFLLGLVVGATTLGGHHPHWYALLGTGFCGGFTTFSTFSLDTYKLVVAGSRALAFSNVAASLAAGMMAAFAGWYLAEAIWGDLLG